MPFARFINMSGLIQLCLQGSCCSKLKLKWKLENIFQTITNVFGCIASNAPPTPQILLVFL